jgi:hypothetical protein
MIFYIKFRLNKKITDFFIFSKELKYGNQAEQETMSIKKRYSFRKMKFICFQIYLIDTRKVFSLKQKENTQKILYVLTRS